MYLELEVSIDSSQPADPSIPLNCTVTYTGVGESSIDLDPSNNLLTRTALYVLRCHDQQAFPSQTHVHIHNPIPLGRGLGSSGAAVVAGVLLGNVVGNLNLPRPRLLDFSLMVERHPDNVAAALYGGFVGTYLNDLDPVDMARKEVPLSEVLPQPAGGVDTGIRPPIPPLDIGHYRRFQWAKEIKAVAIIPDFEVSTARAREVLPKTYSRQDMVRRPSLRNTTIHTIQSCLCIRHQQTKFTNRQDRELDLQPSTPRPAHHRPFRLPSRPQSHLQRNARPDPPTLPPNPHPRSDSNITGTWPPLSIRSVQRSRYGPKEGNKRTFLQKPTKPFSTLPFATTFLNSPSPASPSSASTPTIIH